MRRRSNTAHIRREAELPSGELSEVSTGMRAGSAGSLKIPTLALLINTVLALPNPEDESNIHRGGVLPSRILPNKIYPDVS